MPNHRYARVRQCLNFVLISASKGMSMDMSMSRLSPRKMMVMESQSHSFQAPPAPDIVLKDVETIRTDFRETWLWTNVTSGFVFKIITVQCFKRSLTHQIIQCNSCLSKYRHLSIYSYTLLFCTFICNKINVRAVSILMRKGMGHTR